jgi:WhiB family redox-sensing transcriptional regulator
MTSTEPADLRTRGDQTWQQQAVCMPTKHRPVDPEIFFPEPDEMDRIRAAKALCAQCPVRRVCLDAALENRDRRGIRGGLTEQERYPLHRNLPHRLDYARVNAALAGRDIYLTTAERHAVARIADQAGMSATELARRLKITDSHARKLYRNVRRTLRHRSAGEAAHQDLPSTTGTTQDDLGTAA